MTVYGNFETTEQVFKSQHSSIWSARAAGTEDSADCCIKLLELDQSMIEQRDTTLAQNLLVSAALQQAMGNKSEFWAPVYGLGSQGTNAFYASRLFPRSVQTLIDNKTAMTSAELRTIVLAVIDGLIDLDSAFHRTHSNLKPTNVLIDDPSRIREGGIMLCDPDASSEEVASLSRAPDTKAIGQIIYALVTHRPHSTAHWPLPKSDDWRELGSTGRQWRSLCDNLLNTVSRRGLPTLRHVRDQVAAIAPTRRRMSRAVIALVAVAAIGGAAYAKRAQLPGLYHQASQKITALMAKPSSPTLASSHVSSGPSTVMSVESPKQSTSLAVIPNNPAESPKTAAALIAPIPTIPPSPSVEIPKPKPTQPPAPVSPKPDVEALKTIEGTESPEFHSETAKAEFLHKRDNYALAHTGSVPNDLLADWAKILSKIQGIDADYPAVDVASTTGWPVGVGSLVSARRDAMLVRAIDSAFDQQHADPSAFQATRQRVQTAGTAVAVAHDALARGDIPASQKAIAQCDIALRAFPDADADLLELFGPVHKEFAQLDDVANTTNRAALLEIADTEGASLAVRLSAWQHAGSLPGDAWPATLSEVTADQTRADRLTTLLQEAGSVDIAKAVAQTESERQNKFYASLRDQPSVLAAVKEANDPKDAALLAKAPVWFQYDAALFVLRNTLPTQVTDEQKKNYTDLAGQVDAPGVQLVHEVLKAAEEKPPTLPQSGPGSVNGWQIRGGWTKDHCIYISNDGDTLEFIRVHVADDPDGVDCYLCTTETPLTLMQHLLNGNAVALATAEALNSTTSPPKPGMRLWAFDDKNVSVNLDEDDYRKCFVVSPNEQMPVQMISPQSAFYLARRVGCRLPTSPEWTAALAQAKTSRDANVRGFATLGWKLRDREFAQLLTNPNRDPDCWPDDNIFLGNLDPAQVPRAGSAAVWSTASLSTLGGSVTSDNPPPAAWPLSTLQTSSGFGFRAVGDGENFAGVFHDLIGNVAEYVMDAPVILAEKVPAATSLSRDQIVRGVNDWFSTTHLAGVAVIGGSSLSPPNLDPTKPAPLPRDANQFSDVGFRLSFTDPTCIANAQRQVIGQAPYLTAP